MSERLTFATFLDLHNNVALGYTLIEGEPAPETHQELMNFVGKFFDLEAPVAPEDLREIVDSPIVADGPWWDLMDLEHAEAAVLIQQLADPDAFVSTLPADESSFVLPTPEFVRLILQLEAITA